MEKCSVRDAGLKLKEWFSVTGEAARRAAKANAVESPEARESTPVSNKPQTFQLRDVDPTHPYLAERGIAEETARGFGVGFFSGRGSMSGRIVIPIHKSGENWWRMPGG